MNFRFYEEEKITMTYKQFLNTTTDKTKLATFLYNFCVSFYSEKLEEICDKPCEECGDSCYGCIAELLNKEMNNKLLER